MDRTSRRTVNQVTIKEMMKMIREIKNVARKELPSTKSMGDRIERAWEGEITRASPSSEGVSAGSLPDLLRVGLLGFHESVVDVVAGTRGTPPPSLLMWIAWIELGSSVTIDGISGVLPVLEWVENHEENRQGSNSSEG
jgi:hypothetical protein